MCDGNLTSNREPFLTTLENPIITCLNARRSVPAKQLAEPGPAPETLARILAAAVRVPDHGKLVPWRFLRIAEDARETLGKAVAARALAKDPQIDDAMLEKDRTRFQSPLVIAVVARLGADEKIPEQERFASACCVCFALLLAAQSESFGAQWLTGWPAYDATILQLLGLSPDERIAGFIHIGTPKREIPERNRPDPLALLSDWSPA
ncbi:MAG: nitroreductase [Luteimonas sp.]